MPQLDQRTFAILRQAAALAPWPTSIEGHEAHKAILDALDAANDVEMAPREAKWVALISARGAVVNIIAGVK